MVADQASGMFSDIGFQPILVNMKTIAITIDDECLENLDRIARRAGGNRSKLVRLALREYLTRAERAAEDAREREIIRQHRSVLHRQAAALVKAQAKS
jgi:metal-responsive CopG/Arc/MetJ family transcriptional regulator